MIDTIDSPINAGEMQRGSMNSPTSWRYFSKKVKLNRRQTDLVKQSRIGPRLTAVHLVLEKMVSTASAASGDKHEDTFWHTSRRNLFASSV